MHPTANRPQNSTQTNSTLLQPISETPPRPPDVTNSIDSQKDLLDTDLDRNVDIEENSPFQEGTGGSHLSRTAVKLDSRLAWIFVAKFLCVIKLVIIMQ